MKGGLDAILLRDTKFCDDMIALTLNYGLMPEMVEKYQMCECRLNQYRGIYARQEERRTHSQWDLMFYSMPRLKEENGISRK